MKEHVVGFRNWGPLAFLALAVCFLTYGFFFGPTQRSASVYQTARRFAVFIHDDEDRSSGTGWIHQEGGRYFIVTANHVVSDGAETYVSFDDRKGYHKVKKHGWDTFFDVAVMTFEDQNAVPAHAAVVGSDFLDTDETVFTVGNPRGVRFVGLQGRIAIYQGRVPGFQFYYRPMMIDLTCNPGQSGGAILNKRAEVVGMITSIDSVAGNDGRPLCYGISINVVKKLLPKLMAGGEVKHGMIGILFTNAWELTPSQKRKHQLENVAGSDAVVVGVVREGFPAQRAGIQKRDVLLEVSGSQDGPWIPIREEAEFNEYWNSTFFAGDEAFLKLRRGNTHFLKKITLIPSDAAPQ